MKTFFYKTYALILLFLICLGFGSSVQATVYPFNVAYSGANEVPSNGSTATGTISGTYDDATNTISYTINFSGLSDSTTAAHFHGPAIPGVSAGVLYAHDGFPVGVTSGSLGPINLVISDTAEMYLLAGLVYSNIHSEAFPGGEIRAQIFFSSITAPTAITCPSDTTVSNTLDSCSASVAFDSATATGTPTPVISYRIGGTVITSPYVFPVGTTEVTATAINGGGALTCTFNVTVNDTQPPEVTCPADITVSNDSGLCGAVVNFTPTATDNCSIDTITSVPASGSFFPVGTTSVTVTATDASGNTATCSFNVTVNDTEPPVITGLHASPDTLWPPNHKLRNIPVNYDATDNCGVDTCILSVTSDEPVHGWGSGNTSPDWLLTSNNHLIKLRAERAGTGDGRLYTITVTCTDTSGNAGMDSTTVLVPHDHRGFVSAEMLIQALEEAREGEGQLDMRAYPNPSRNYFTLDIYTENFSEKLNVKITDVIGRLVESRTNLSGSQTLKIGTNLKPGVYFVEVIQGEETKYLKLVKTE